MSRETVSLERRILRGWTGGLTVFCLIALATVGGPARWILFASGCLNATLFCASLLEKKEEKKS